MTTLQFLIDKLAREHDLSDAELLELITAKSPEVNHLLATKADAVRQQYYGKKVYIRGLIEFTNY